MRRVLASPLVLAVLASGCILHDERDYAARIEALLDESDVSLAAALRVPDRSFGDAWLLAGELDAYAGVFEADFWDGASLMRAEVDLGGRLVDVDDFGWDPRADAAVDVIAAADISLYQAIEIAEDAVSDARAFDVAVRGDRFEVDVVAHLRIYHVSISPDDGDVVDIDVERDHGHHGLCPCW